MSDYYVYDGHGSTRALTDSNGAVTDTYDYDAFGNLLHSTGTTFNEFLFAGEQFDSDLGLYYNRARYLNVSTGRFWTMDTFEGNSLDPLSLHKYGYAESNPVGQVDPSGNQTEVDELVGETDKEIVGQGTTLAPQVIETVEETAESVVVAAEVKDSLIGAILIFTLTAGVAVNLKGDNEPGPNPAPKNRDNSANRGSLQVQGRDILENQSALNLVGHNDFKLDKNTLSWNWAQPDPLDVFTANAKLTEFLAILTPVQIGRRKNAFKEASRFINRGPSPPVRMSFNDRDNRYPDARVDVIVDAGWAFVRVP